MKHAKSLDFILAGGKGKRLFPVTRDRAKPAAPYGGKWRIIDLPLNNHYNSGSRNIVVAVQYKPDSLKRHIEQTWRQVFEREGAEFIRLVQPEHGTYAGTADAVYKNLGLIEEQKPQLVSVFAGDHVYLMDISQMKQSHLDNKTDLTIAAMPVRRDLAANTFGVLVVDGRGNVIGFQEKPSDPAPIPGNENFCWASMGNYVFNRAYLAKALRVDARKETAAEENKDLVRTNPNLYSLHDFGFDIIPFYLREGRNVKMYDYTKNKPDQITTTSYWRDVGTLDQFVEANLDLTGAHPLLVLENPGWPLVTFDESRGKSIIGAEYATGSILANGVSIGKRSRLEDCVVGYNTEVGEHGEMTKTIFMGNNVTGRNVRINNGVIDKGVRIPDNTRIGIYHDEDTARGFTLSPSGRVFLQRNYQFR